MQAALHVQKYADISCTICLKVCGHQEHCNFPSLEVKGQNLIQHATAPVCKMSSNESLYVKVRVEFNLHRAWTWEDLKYKMWTQLTHLTNALGDIQINQGHVFIILVKILSIKVDTLIHCLAKIINK